jgi:hypothetical protein
LPLFCIRAEVPDVFCRIKVSMWSLQSSVICQLEVSATGRTAQLSTRVQPETLQLLRQLAVRDRITMAEVIERALDLYASK